MNFKSILFFLFLLSIFSCKSEVESIAEQATTRNSLIDSTITAFQKKLLKHQIDSVFSTYDFNGSVSVITGKNVLYEEQNGFENFGIQKKLDSSSVFAIASVSKQFTAVLIMLQEDQGKLNSEDLVSKYLPDFNKAPFQAITIHQLLNHTSGISDFGNGLLSKPGEEFHYSNKGFRLLGEIIEKVSGHSYDENISQLFNKFGLKSSFTANTFNANNLAGAYIGTAKNYQQVENMPKRLATNSISVPAGGILSTVNDLHRWNTSLYEGRILKPESLNKIMAKSSNRNHQILGKMGYGFGIMMNVGKPNAYFHTGYVKGAPSLLIYYPENQTSVVILSNIANEAQGKNSIFNPHKKIKQITDAIQNTVIELRTELIKPMAN